MIVTLSGGVGVPGLIVKLKACRAVSGRGAENPLKWGNFFDFRAAYAQPPQAGATMPPVRVTLPDGTIVTTGQDDPEPVLSRPFGRDVALEEARPGDRSPGATATIRAR